MKNEEFIKDEETTDLNFGWYPRSRPIKEYIETGVINLDKPPGPTSHEVVAWVKRLLSLSRAGHGGTLDPKVTGVLPIALGRATRLISFIMKSGKEYVTIMELHGNVSDYDLRRVIEEFIGPIYQLPPIRSSVKRALRIRTIHSIKVLERIGKYVLMKVSCEAGTYIRKLCHDIGEVLGCGAHMKELRRIRAGPFTEKNSVTMHFLLDAITLWKENNDESLLRKVILPVEEILLDIPKIYVRDSAVDALCHGANLASPGVLRISKNIKAGDLVCVMTLKGELIGIGKALKSSEEIFESNHGIVVDMERIIMEPGTYPKCWG